MRGNGDILTMQDMYPISKCNCQEQITFAPRQFELERSGFKSKLKKTEGSQKAWDKFHKPVVNVAALFFGMIVGAKI